MELFVPKDLSGQAATTSLHAPCGPDAGHYWLARRLAVFSLKVRARQPRGARPRRRRPRRGLLRSRVRSREA
jgi:hypothetical protein